ncbi:putative ribonuclease H-like domain-containing protein [Tanacetum coccineum]
MTGNKSYLSNYEEIDGGFVAFGRNSKGGKITRKGKIGTGKLDFEDAYFVKELKFNLFSVSQMCDKKNNVLFTDTECVVLSSELKLTDENHVLLKVSRKNNMYIVDLRNVVPQGGLTCLFAKATIEYWCPVTILNTLDHLGSGPEWHFDIDTLTKSMNYKPAVVVNQTNGNVDDKVANDVEKKTTEDPTKEDDKDDQDLREFERLIVQGKEAKININSTNSVSAVSSPINTAGTKDAGVNSTNNIYTASPLVNFDWLSYFNTNPPDDPKMPNLEDTGIFGGPYDDEDFVVGGDMNNLESSMPVSPIATTRVHKDHPVEQIIRDLHSAPQTRRTTKNSEEHVEPKKVIQDLTDPSWIEEMQDELIQNKKVERGIVVRNKARLVAQGYTQEEGIDYDEVFAPVARIEAIRLVLAYASFINFVVYQMDVKSAFMSVNLQDDIIFGSTKKELCNEFEKLMHDKFQMSSMGELTFFLGLQVMQKEDGIFISQDKSIIGSLMYLTTSRPDIMFVVCACVRFQVTPKVSHLYAVKRIFRYLKGQPKLGLWYPKDSPFDLESYFDNDYGDASLDRKSTIGGCQFLRSRLISWQCKKQTIVGNSTTKAEYVAAANCYGQVLWIQNQMLDYGYNFMNTKIFIDNGSTICIVKNLVFHAKTKHIEIRHHFIRDSYEKRLIQVIKIHTDHNVADLVTKALDVSRFQFLTANIGMLNL